MLVFNSRARRVRAGPGQAISDRFRAASRTVPRLTAPKSCHQADERDRAWNSRVSRMQSPSRACRSMASRLARTPASSSRSLDDFEKRKSRRSCPSGAIAMQLNGKFSGIQDAFIAMFPPPPVNGLGSTGGFKLQIEDRAGLGYQAARQRHQGRSLPRPSQAPELAGLFSSFQINVPQLYRRYRPFRRPSSSACAVTDVFDTLQIYLGSLYVNDFNAFGRTYSVSVSRPTAAYRRCTRRHWPAACPLADRAR